MATLTEYSQLSARAYDASIYNRTGVPANWSELSWLPDDGLTGFSAGVYQQGNEIVIAYTGTNDKVPDLSNAALAGLGVLPAPQVYAAMRLYLDVKRANQEPKGVSFAILQDEPCHDAHALN